MDEFFILLREILSERSYYFVIGFIGGVLACWRFCPAYWQWRTHRFDVEREDRLHREQECREARANLAKLRHQKQLDRENRKRAEADHLMNERKIWNGILIDRFGQFYCPVCHTPLIANMKDGFYRFYCPKDDKIFHIRYPFYENIEEFQIHLQDIYPTWPPGSELYF